MSSICFIIAGIVLVRMIRTIRRNNDVYEFRMWILEISNMIFNDRHHDIVTTGKFYEYDPADLDYINKIFGSIASYHDMLYSNRPLTIEEWLSEDIVEDIKTTGYHLYSLEELKSMHQNRNGNQNF